MQLDIGDTDFAIATEFDVPAFTSSDMILHVNLGGYVFFHTVGTVNLEFGGASHASRS